MVVLAAVWLGAASRIHVNASWSDGAWGYAAFPLFGEDPKVGDRVLFDPPETLGSPVPYLKTVRGVPGMAVTVGPDSTVHLDGVPMGRAKTHALDGRPLAAIAPGVIPPGHYYLFAGPRRIRTTAATRKSALCRGRAFSAAPSACRTSPGSASTGRWSGRRTRMPETRRSCRSRRTDRPRLPEAGRETPGLAAAGGAGRGAGAGARHARLREGPRRARRDLAGGRAGPAGADRGAPRRDGTLGALARLEDEARDGARRMLEEPEPAPGIAPARESRSRLWDPAITVARDIRTAAAF